MTGAHGNQRMRRVAFTRLSQPARRRPIWTFIPAHPVSTQEKVGLNHDC